MPPEERQLIADYLANDRAAIAQVEQWIVGAASPFRRRLNADWEDALSQTQLKLFSAFQGEAFRGEATLKTYVARVTSYTCIDLLRQKTRRPMENLDDFPDLIGLIESPEDRLMWSEICLRVWAQMSEKCRKSLARMLAGQSYEEMSRDLHELPGTLRRRVHDCHKQATLLREQLLARQKGVAA